MKDFPGYIIINIINQSLGQDYKKEQVNEDCLHRKKKFFALRIA
jgi:hypothetical protein